MPIPIRHLARIERISRAMSADSDGGKPQTITIRKRQSRLQAILDQIVRILASPTSPSQAALRAAGN